MWNSIGSNNTLASKPYARRNKAPKENRTSLFKARELRPEIAAKASSPSAPMIRGTYAPKVRGVLAYKSNVQRGLIYPRAEGHALPKSEVIVFPTPAGLQKARTEGLTPMYSKTFFLRIASF